MKICVLGLEGAAPDIVFGDERLVNLRRLMDLGAYGRLESVIPPIAVPGWMCMSTSQDPGSLGVYGLRNRSDHSYAKLAYDKLGFTNSGSIKALAIWGLEYTMHTPSPGETVYPEHMMGVLSISLNRRGLRLPQPVTWTVCFGPKSVFTLSFDGQQWSVEPTDVPDADVRIETTPETWAAFLYSPKDERQRLLEAMRISGEPVRVNELLAIKWIEKQP